jgi:hypothetical protein
MPNRFERPDVRPFPVRGFGARSFGFERSVPTGSRPTGSRESAPTLARRLHDTLAALHQPHDDEPLGPPDDAA